MLPQFDFSHHPPPHHFDEEEAIHSLPDHSLLTTPPPPNFDGEEAILFLTISSLKGSTGITSKFWVDDDTIPKDRRNGSGGRQTRLAGTNLPWYVILGATNISGGGKARAGGTDWRSSDKYNKRKKDPNEIPHQSYSHCTVVIDVDEDVLLSEPVRAAMVESQHDLSPKTTSGHSGASNSESRIPSSIHVPTTPSGVGVPLVGIVFGSTDQERQFYDIYTDATGFGIKTSHSSKERNNKSAARIIFTCVKGGQPPNKCKDTLYRYKSTTRTGCPSYIKLKHTFTGEYQISHVQLSHNHPMLQQDMMWLLPSKRRISVSIQRQIDLNDTAGIGAAKTMSSLVIEAGGYDDLTFTQKDLNNHLLNYQKLRLGEGDAIAIQAYFVRIQKSDPEFFYVLDLNDEGVLRNIFWADARSRMAYKYFGDIVTFDTTYLTNRYEILFVPFVGVNHHGQSTLLGCGQLCEETMENYVWPFTT